MGSGTNANIKKAKAMIGECLLAEKLAPPNQKAGDVKGPSGATMTVEIVLPKEKVGAVIGPSGARITQIRNDSMANIRITDSTKSGTEERVLSITGTKQM